MYIGGNPVLSGIRRAGRKPPHFSVTSDGTLPSLRPQLSTYPDGFRLENDRQASPVRGQQPPPPAHGKAVRRIAASSQRRGNISSQKCILPGIFADRPDTHAMQKTYHTPATRRFTTGKDRSSHRFPVSLRPPHRSVARRFGLTSKPGPFVRLSVSCSRRPYLRGKRKCGPDRSGEDLREAQTHLSRPDAPSIPHAETRERPHAVLRYRSHRKSMALSMARQHTGQKRSPLRMQHASAGR